MPNNLDLASPNALMIPLLTGLSLWGAPALAQPAAEPAAEATSTDEIVVTARKRDETSIAVPVVLTAVSGAELERRAIVNLDNLTRVVPQLQLGTGGGTIQGGHVGIRGISGSDSNPFADQAVSFNIDGVQVSRSNIRRMAEMDIGQVEVLKGPQALFFGKNSPGGIISIRSADPTSSFQAKASVGYEFYAREWRSDAFVSGPITDTLGARLAIFSTRMRGWFDNDVDDSNIFRSGAKHSPKTKEYAVRGTLKWEPSDRFDARLKVTYNNLKDIGILTAQERKDCPLGAPQLGGGPDNCKLDGQGARLYLGPLLGTISPLALGRFRDGDPYLRMKQALVSNEMNYDLSDQLLLTSVTGFYYLDQRWADNFNMAWNPAQVLPSSGFFGNKEFSQEVRLTSDYEGPVNFMVGAFYQKARAYVGAHSYIGAVPSAAGVFTQLNNYKLRQRGQAYSWFGQVMIKPVEQIEITAGGRYSYERKRLTHIEAARPVPGPAPIPRAILPEDPRFPRKESWTDFSPEFTIAYRPSGDLTLFASYKRGFLSGGFNSGATNFNSDLRFDQQVIKGFEGGVKAALLDRALRTNFALYRYQITGLQITTSTTTSAGTVQTVLNAGKTTIKGAEFDFDYKTPLQGLSLHGAVGYNDTKYNVFSGGCYGGQTQEEGCNFGAFTSTIIGGQTFTTYALQDLAGRQLLRAPKWSGNAGAGFEGDMGSSLRFGLNVDVTFSSAYDTNVTASPASRQKSWQILDAGARIGAQDDSWEVALIGRNLTDKFYLVRSVDTPFAGAGTGRAANDPRGSFHSDTQGAVNRGREIMLRVTVRYGGES